MDPVSLTRRTYDAIAATYAEQRAANSPALVADADEFATGVDAGWVADVGCGPGRDIRALREHGLSVVGMDLSLAMLAAGGVPGVVQADMRALPLATGALAGVWCEAALLHVPHHQVPGVLAEFARVCRSGGRLHLTVAEGDGEHVEPGAYGSDQPRFFALHRFEQLQRLLTDQGFTVIGVRTAQSHRRWLRVAARLAPVGVAGVPPSPLPPPR